MADTRLLRSEPPKRLSRLRLRETRILLQEGCAAGAYYLAGYAVECALKACIARHTRRFEFPERDRVNTSYTHDLRTLVRVAGLQPDLEEWIQTNKAFQVNWGLVRDWSEQSRYDDSMTLPRARDLYRAVVERRSGVMRWLRPHW